MSTYRVAYCTENDVQSILPNIADYDRKRIIGNWSTYSGSTYQSGSTGSVDMLYRDGLELGAAQSSLGDLNTDGEWFYDSSADVCYLYSTNDPATSHVIEGGKDYSTIMTEAINRASEMVDSIVGKPIYPKKGVGYQGQTTRDYDEVIILSTAGLTASLLVRPFDKDLADEIEGRWNNEETGLGMLQLIRRGDVKLHHEVGEENEGLISEVSVNGSSTGSPIDVKGSPTADDLIKVQIQTGGTFTYGSASSVTYSTWVGDGSTSLKIQKVIDAETIHGGYQNIGHGVSIRFSQGVYTANDEWQVEVSNSFPETHNSIKYAQAER